MSLLKAQVPDDGPPTPSAEVYVNNVLLDGSQQQVNSALSKIAALERGQSTTDARSLSNAATHIQLVEDDTRSMRSDIEGLRISVLDPGGEVQLLHEQVNNALRSSTQVGSGVERHGIRISHPSEIHCRDRRIHSDFRHQTPPRVSWIPPA
jgi:hypothetical protein